MSNVTRRNFIAGAAGLAAWGMLARTIRAESGFRIGCQSYSFRKFGLEDSIAQLKKLGLSDMEFCGVHFPCDAAHENFATVKAVIAETKIRVPVYGVESFGKDAAANRKKFEFAKALGIEILSADPEPDSFDQLDELVEEFGVAIAIHNHGPRARYDKVGDTLKAVEKRHARIGACLDTGHCIRSGEKPHETAKALGARLISLHLKDWIHGGEEQVLGEGDMDLAALAGELKALAFDGPIMIEYEEHPDDPAPHMMRGLENWRKASA